MPVLCRLSYSSACHTDPHMIERLASPRRALPLALAALVLAACGNEPDAPPPTSEAGFPTGTLIVETSEGEVRIEVEIAQSLEQRVQGLRHRRSLPPDAGMVFVPPIPQQQVFVMEDTLIPLSVAWWDEDGRIFAIQDMTPCRKEDCPGYDSGRLSAGAVEVNQGFFEEHGVEVGDRVRLERM
jgi:uncharacterized protein